LTTTNLIVSAAPPERAGSASAISETSAEFGGALGIALLGSLGTVIYRTFMTNVESPAIARTTLSAAIEEANQLGADNADWLIPARDAFAAGFATTCAVAALGLALLAWTAWQVFRQPEVQQAEES
jgi:DHA2 family multidrug resistance protein-like MFS transporter